MKDVQDTSSGSRRTSISLEDCGPDVLQLAMNYTSDYLDYVENLPFDLQRNVTKLREVDQKCREYVKEMEQLYDNFMKEDGGVPSVRRRSYLLQIRRLFGLCKELGDEKISILQSVSEAIESRNKQLEHGCKRFKYAYEPCIKTEHNGKKDKDSRSDSTRGNKRSRRQRNNNSAENKDKNQQQYSKDPEKFSKTTSYDDADEPPPKVMLSSSSPDHSSPAASSVPALTRSALREEDKRAASRSKDKKDEKHDKDTEQNSSTTASVKGSNETAAAATTSSMATTSSTANTSSTSKTKSSNVTILSSSTAGKTNSKGKKKKRKSNKLQTEKQVKNSGEVSPIIDIPIDPDEPTYCLCQQVSFGQMIGCDNLKCPIEWFHFSCVRLTTKPKGKWYCPDCTIKRKRDGKRADNR